MIHSKIKKGETKQLMVEFSTQPELPQVILGFQTICQQESVRIKKNPNLPREKIRFYQLDLQTNRKKSKNSSFGEVLLKDAIIQQKFKFSVIYINEEDYILPPSPQERTILLRETLQNFYSIDYEVEDTQSETESVIYLCGLASMVINCNHQVSVDVLDQRADKCFSKAFGNQISEAELFWKNIVFQTPGVGREKCEAIVKHFPTYQHILKDYYGDQQLKNIKCERGVKQTRLGKAIADKIYRIFTSLNGEELVN